MRSNRNERAFGHRNSPPRRLQTLRAALETEPRAIAARYSRKTGRVTVDLANGCAYVFPADLPQDLSEASPDELASVEVNGAGFNLHWPKLDADV